MLTDLGIHAKLTGDKHYYHSITTMSYVPTYYRGADPAPVHAGYCTAPNVAVPFVRPQSRYYHGVHHCEHCTLRSGPL